MIGARFARWPVLLAIACVAAAAAAPPIPVWLCVGLLVAAVVRVHPVLVSLAVVALSGALGAQALEGGRPLAPGRFSGIVQLVDDPRPWPESARVDVRTSRGRLRLDLSRAGVSLSERLTAGDRFHVSGRVEPDGTSDRSRHLRGTLIAEQIGVSESRPMGVAMIEALRASIVRGARVLPEEMRPIYLGFVIGDDRGISPVRTSDFRGSGLAHLSVVSGANLAFILLLMAPVLRLLGARSRMLVIVSVLIVFGAVTRLEPSVLRAMSMAGVVAIAHAIGRPVSMVRVLSLAVVVLVLADPMILWSLGFRLSLAATLGIVLLLRPIAALIPGPRRLALAIALPTAAQVGVAPVAVPAFGLPALVSLPANVLVEPTAAFVMMWGTTVGFISGVVPGTVAAALQLPARVAVGWIMIVAEQSTRPAGARVGAWSVLTIVVIVMVGRTRWSRRPKVAAIVGTSAVIALIVALCVVRPSAVSGEPIGRARLWVAAGSDASSVLTIAGDARVDELLSALRLRGIEEIDLLVRLTESTAAREAEQLLRSRVRARRTISPDTQQGVTAPDAQVLAVGSLVVTVRLIGDRIGVGVIDNSEHGVVHDGG